MWSRSMRAIAALLGRQPRARARRGRRVEDHEVARIDEDLDRLRPARSRGRRAPASTQRASAKSRWTKLSEPVISVTVTLRAAPATAAALGRVERQMVGLEADRVARHRQGRRDRAGTGRLDAAVEQEAVARLAQHDGVERRIGEDLRRDEVVRLRKTSIVGPNWVTRPSRQRRGVAAEQQRLVRLGRRVDEDRAGLRRRCVGSSARSSSRSL